MVDNEPEGGPGKNSQRPAARPATGGRKPAAKPAAKPTAKPTVKPTAKSTVKPAAKPTAKSVSTPAATPASTPPTVPRLSVARLTLPGSGLPQLAIPSVSVSTAPPAEAHEAPAADGVGDIIEVIEVVEPVGAEPVGAEPEAATSMVLSVRGLTKSFDNKVAVDGIDLDVHVGAFYGIVGPNGAGKTTTLSMITGLLRPTAGSIVVNGADVWSDPVVAKRTMGVLPDRLRLFDRLTGSQVLYYAGVLRGLDSETVRKRTADLAQAFGLEEALGRLVTDYSAGMTKKIALAAAMIHTPRLLVLDEPFESVDPVSAATVTEILKNYVAFGGTVVLSSHSMDLVQRICDHVAVIVNGVILADGTMAHVRNGLTLEDRFVELAGGRKTVEGLEWLHTFSD